VCKETNRLIICGHLRCKHLPPVSSLVFVHDYVCPELDSMSYMNATTGQVGALSVCAWNFDLLYSGSYDQYQVENGYRASRLCTAARLDCPQM
jgi:hypothetical protein